MRYSGIQPQYFPRLHYFARMLNTDIFVLRDEVQFVARHKYPDGKIGSSYQADTPIKQVNGEFFLHVPISHDGLLPINQTNISYMDKWPVRHLASIKYSYIKSPNFQKFYPEIEMILKNRYETIGELNIASFLWGVLTLMGESPITLDKLTVPYVQNILDTKKPFRVAKIVLASTVKSYNNPSLDKNFKIIESMKELGANEDYCGETSFSAYMDEPLFKRHGLKITIQDWKCKEYPQLFAKQQPFIPNLSIIDLLMNVSTNDALQILQVQN